MLRLFASLWPPVGPSACFPRISCFPRQCRRWKCALCDPKAFVFAFGRFGCILTFFCKSSMAILLLRFAGFQIPVGRCLFLHRGAQLLYSTARMELGSASMCQVLRTLQPGSSHQEIVAPAYVVRMALRTSIRTVSCKIPSEICVWCRVAKNSPPSFETLVGICAFCEHASWITGTCT